MKDETTIEILSEETLPTSETTVIFNENKISSTTFIPGEIKSNDPENPVPVSGYAERFSEPSPIINLKTPYKLVQGSDGRFKLEPSVIIGPDNRIRITNTTSWPYPVHVIEPLPHEPIATRTGLSRKSGTNRFILRR